jgi:lysophospholipase L1-like esterase
MAKQATRTKTYIRRWWHRPAAIAFGLAVPGLAELICILFGWGSPAASADPFVGFREVRPLFVRDGAGDVMRTAPYRLKSFPDQSFPRQKPRGVFRIFCFGGSTVQGNPYAADTAFPTWLRLSLQASQPGIQWEVINCGGISYASYRLANLLEECVAYGPDLLIVCTGHNEFLEDRRYAKIKQAPEWVVRLRRGASHLRIVNLMQAAWHQLTATQHKPLPASPAWHRTILKEEVDAWLDYEGGLKVYHRDEVWREGVIAHFELNLRRMMAIAQTAGIPVMLIKPTSNLRDCPPFKSQHRDGLSRSELEQWAALVDEARTVLSSAPSQAAELLQSSLRLDDEYALTFYQLGKACEAQGRTEEAKRAYLQARELDVCPLRILTPMEGALDRVAADTGTPMIDAQALLQSQREDGIPGDDWLLDHVHPSIEGHQVIAAALLGSMVRQRMVTVEQGWEERRDRAYSNHLAALPPTYYADGARALEGLRAWTEGRASGPPIEYWLMGRKAEEK